MPWRGARYSIVSSVQRGPANGLLSIKCQFHQGNHTHPTTPGQINFTCRWWGLNLCPHACKICQSVWSTVQLQQLSVRCGANKLTEKGRLADFPSDPSLPVHWDQEFTFSVHFKGGGLGVLENVMWISPVQFSVGFVVLSPLHQWVRRECWCLVRLAGVPLYQCQTGALGFCTET